jgi:hypothetical protein
MRAVVLALFLGVSLARDPLHTNPLRANPLRTNPLRSTGEIGNDHKYNNDDWVVLNKEFGNDNKYSNDDWVSL